MIGLARGQKVLERFNVSSRIGSGILYLLVDGISFEAAGKGLSLELGHDEIILVEAGSGYLLISWREGDGEQQARFGAKDAGDIAGKISECVKSWRHSRDLSDPECKEGTP